MLIYFRRGKSRTSAVHHNSIVNPVNVSRVSCNLVLRVIWEVLTLFLGSNPITGWDPKIPVPINFLEEFRYRLYKRSGK